MFLDAALAALRLCKANLRRSDRSLLPGMLRLLRRTACRGAFASGRGFSGGPSAEAIAAIQANFKKNPAQAMDNWGCFGFFRVSTVINPNKKGWRNPK